ncbi:MAG: LysR family transcriptional regulator [Actinobacteria bacterium]|nr:LysR family transcriptional regulator [Actinomycetota bacterium]
MEIRDLDYFLVCCRTGSFTAAAREVHIVQSAMSSAIARLEHELGVPLFDRSVTPVTVTEHGRALQAGAQRIVAAVQAARDEVAAVSGVVAGTVVLGCTLHTGPLDLAAVLTSLRERHAGVVVQLRQSITGSSGNLQAVADGTMDIALTGGQPSSPHEPHRTGPSGESHQPGLPLKSHQSGSPLEPHQPGPPRQPRGPRSIQLTPLVTEPLVLVCPDGHPLARRPQVTTAELTSENILRFPPGWGIRTTVEAVLGPSPAATEVADYTLMLKLIEAGFGTTLLPASALAHGHRGLRAIPTDDPRLAWHLSAAVSASRPPTAATSALLAALTESAPRPTRPP